MGKTFIRMYRTNEIKMERGLQRKISIACEILLKLLLEDEV